MFPTSPTTDSPDPLDNQLVTDEFDVQLQELDAAADDTYVEDDTQVFSGFAEDENEDLNTQIQHLLDTSEPIPLESSSSKGSHRRSIVTTIALAVLPVLGMGAIAYFATAALTTNQTQRTQTQVSQVFANSIDRFLAERVADVHSIARSPLFTNAEIRSNRTITLQSKQSLLIQAISTPKTFDWIGIVSPSGSLQLQAGTPPNPLPSNMATQPYIKVPASGKVYIGQFGQNWLVISAPIQDAATGGLVGIVLAQMPLQALNSISTSPESQSYLLADSAGKVFLASAPDAVGQALADLKQPMAVQTAVGNIPGLPPLGWSLATESVGASAGQVQTNLLLGTLALAVLAGTIAATLGRQSTQSLDSTLQVLTQLQAGELDVRLSSQGDGELAVLSAKVNALADQLQAAHQQHQAATQLAQLLPDVTLRIRQFLNLESVLKTAVREVRSVLQVDRAVIYQLDPTSWIGAAIVESIAPGIPPMLGARFEQPTFREQHMQLYKAGQMRIAANLAEELLPQDPYRQMLEQFAVISELVAPIRVRNQLFGLLVVHACTTPRPWQPAEIHFLNQTALQIGIALEQASLVEQLEKARQQTEQAAEEQRQQRQAIQMQLVDLLSDIEEAARGDLTVRADVTVGEIGTVADFFNAIIESLRQIVTQVKQGAEQVNVLLGANESAIRQLADDAIAQAHEITHTLTSVEDMTLSIQDVAASARQAAEVARTASTTAQAGGTAMDRTVQSILNLRETVAETAKKVKRLGESSQQISRVVSLINQIALQTNLLAINASIEAARAGEEGRGFAVVAEEVGQLAAQSAAATREIEQIVETIQLETSEVVGAMELGTAQVVEGTRLVEDAKLSLGKILQVSSQIDELVQSISTATVSQVQTSQAVTDLMKEIARASERTSGSSRQVAQALKQTVAVSQELQAAVDVFKVGEQ